MRLLKYKPRLKKFSSDKMILTSENIWETRRFGNH